LPEKNSQEPCDLSWADFLKRSAPQARSRYAQVVEQFAVLSLERMFYSFPKKKRRKEKERETKNLAMQSTL
jgi:hypothetical protein